MEKDKEDNQIFRNFYEAKFQNELMISFILLYSVMLKTTNGGKIFPFFHAGLKMFCYFTLFTGNLENNFLNLDC